MKYNQRLRDLREDKDMTQSQVAKILHMTQTNYAKIENQRNNLSIDGLITLCKFYEVTADFILGFTNEPKQLPKK